MVRSTKATGCGRGFSGRNQGRMKNMLGWDLRLASITARWKALLINPVPIYELSLQAHSLWPRGTCASPEWLGTAALCLVHCHIPRVPLSLQGGLINGGITVGGVWTLRLKGQCLSSFCLPPSAPFCSQHSSAQALASRGEALFVLMRNP